MLHRRCVSAVPLEKLVLILRKSDAIVYSEIQFGEVIT